MARDNLDGVAQGQFAENINRQYKCAGGQVDGVCLILGVVDFDSLSVGPGCELATRSRTADYRASGISIGLRSSVSLIIR
jgi:hypothetical protein